MLIMKKTGPTNIQTRRLIAFLEETARKNKSGLWKRVVSELSKPSRSRCEVNLTKLSAVTKDGETAVVPGKILGLGEATHSVRVAALNASSSAKEKLGDSLLTLRALAEENPKGSNVRLVK